MKSFKIPVPALKGFIWATINGVESLHLDTNGHPSNTPNDSLSLVVRGVPHGFSSHVGLNKGVIDGRTWAADGNKQIWVSDAQNGYYKLRGSYASRRPSYAGEFVPSDSATSKSKEKLFDEVLKAVNIFYQNNKAEFETAWYERSLEDIAKKISTSKNKIEELEGMLKKEKNLCADLIREEIAKKQK